ncbi:DUF5076 domain-containing protein [Sphingomonadaceae bacterium OTU29MARTA1]|uniref:DUF5076 domain-containing protein n=1 Tax=Sphingomonas sp. Leaf37 TaxID=2876552 RepID=UPI001E2A0A22|nr:DUF5076 domain-containing protein [Sphingomonas sp. Leaf37]USU08749.1 DUF5076 domain-containing protein [Sphingomonadaceae bacterium OTU29MARTA1]
MKLPKLRAIPLSAMPNLTDRSAEVARIWITDRAGSTVVIDAGVLSDAETFGVLMADVIGHAAKAHAQLLGLSEDEAAALIWRGLDGARPELDPDAVARIANHPGGLN